MVVRLVVVCQQACNTGVVLKRGAEQRLPIQNRPRGQPGHGGIGWFFVVSGGRYVIESEASHWLWAWLISTLVRAAVGGGAFHGIQQIQARFVAAGFNVEIGLSSASPGQLLQVGDAGFVESGNGFGAEIQRFFQVVSLTQVSEFWSVQWHWPAPATWGTPGSRRLPI